MKRTDEFNLAAATQHRAVIAPDSMKDRGIRL
jgi:hypothetical protein